jgi:hypothetical protein
VLLFLPSYTKWVHGKGFGSAVSTISSNADSYGLKGLKFSWSKVKRKDWFISLCSWNNSFSFIYDWISIVEGGLKKWICALEMIPVEEKEVKSCTNLIASASDWPKSLHMCFNRRFKFETIRTYAIDW